MRNKRILAPALLLIILFILIPASAATSPQYQGLTEKIDAILDSLDSQKCALAVKIVSLDTDETIYERNAHRLMTPASNTKLFTTASALHYLGPDFTIRTSFYFNGKLNGQGVLDGDLVIYGRGDPNISGRFTKRPTAIYEQVVESMKSLGLREVKGDVIGDDSYFDACYYGPWPAEDASRWYAARVSALSFNDNCIDLCVMPAKSPGKKPQITQSPGSSYAKIANMASTTSRRNNSVWATPGGGNSDVQVYGKIWMGKKQEVLNLPVETPALYSATVFKETLEKNGVRVGGRARELENEVGSAVPGGATPVVDLKSYPLSEMIKVVNKRSQNLHAELLLKQVGRQTGNGASFEGGSRAVRNFTQLAGIPVEELDLHDGSGLCRSNKVTADAIIRLLRHMYRNPSRQVFRESLATAGHDDSLRALAHSVPAGSIRGKTGSLKGVFAFSGYADGKTDHFAFSIMANGLRNGSYPVKLARDKICKELVNF